MKEQPRMMNGEHVVSTSDLCAILHIQVSSKLLREQCGCAPAAIMTNAVFWRQSDIPAIFRALARFCDSMAEPFEKQNASIARAEARAEHNGSQP